jgi:hypothetical protein
MLGADLARSGVSGLSLLAISADDDQRSIYNSPNIKDGGGLDRDNHSAHTCVAFEVCAEVSSWRRKRG